jgi:hypothetical protein
MDQSSLGSKQLTIMIGYIDVVPIAGYLGVSNGASIYKNGPKENRRNSVALSMKSEGIIRMVGLKKL